MESRFAHDFSGVRVHADAAAAESARAVHARAYTVGSDIVFGAGEYAPHSNYGRQLLAHELTHTLQQRQGGIRLQRSPINEELDRELKAWADKEKKSIDPSHRDFALNLQEYAWLLINDPVAHGPLAKPKNKEELAAWEKKFKKAQRLAEKILAEGQDVKEREARATEVLILVAQAGIRSGPVELARGITDVDHVKLVYEPILDQAGQADPQSLRTISEVLIEKMGNKGNPLITRLTDRSGSFERGLNGEQLTAILAPLIQKYENDAFLVDLLAEVLVHNPKYREAFSKWMWKEGKGELLFRVVDSKHFVEPGYGGEAFPEAGALEMEKDMPWVYAQKQKYYVSYLVQIGKDTGVDIKAPRKLNLQELRKWLDDNTEKIGQAVAKKYPAEPERWVKVSEQLADIFFYHVDGRDIKPSLTGKLATLGAGAPDKMRLKADCDVLATYAMRYFVGVSDPKDASFVKFEPVGYMAIEPEGQPGHAVALMRRNGQYYVINNKQVSPVNVVEAKPDEKKAEALQALKKDALDIYNTAPKKYRVFYADAPDGAMPKGVADTADSARLTGLEPAAPPSP